MSPDRHPAIFLGICESKWAKTGDFIGDKQRVIYPGDEKNEREVGLILDQEMKK